jgi:ubiquinone/menaquinone biosynthesis C-methylase UbiE
MMATSSDTPRDTYVMGRTSEEYQRLRRQAQTWEFATKRVLQQIGLHSGMRCLDIGCGPGEVMRLMGEMVGPTGQVTGLDTDGKLGREACNVLQETIKSQFAFVEGNVTALSEIGGQPFDVSFARIVLMHIDDPVAVLRKMYAWTKPGGYVVVQEYDFSSWSVYPRSDVSEEVLRVFHGVYEKAKRDSRIGYKLPAYFVEAGMGEPDGTDVAGMLTPLEPYKAFTQALYRSVLPLALQWNITTEAQSQRVLEDVSNITAQQHHYILWPSLVGAWKRKPMESDR